MKIGRFAHLLYICHISLHAHALSLRRERRGRIQTYKMKQKNIHPTAPAHAVASPRRKGATALYYAVGFVLLWIFSTWVYGDVFRHIADENYVCAERQPMFYVLRLPGAYVLWAARYVLLAFLNRWVGGTLLALLLTGVAWCIECLLPKARRGEGWGWWLPLALLAWCVADGFNLFLRIEPSTFVLRTLALLAASATGAVAVSAVRRFCRRDVEAVAPVAPRSWVSRLLPLLPVVAYVGLVVFAVTARDNVRVSCRLQNQLADEDWEAMIETARSAKRPSRTVAALHAVGLEQTDRLLDGLFAISYDYPELSLRNVGGKDEGINYLADLCLYAGLINTAYRHSMDNTVEHGPRLHNFKRMALCALLNGEKRLAERYLNLVDHMPFCHDFAERYRAMLNDSTLLDSDPTLARIRQLRPKIDAFEQAFRQPTVVGYNLVTPTGTDATLITSVAACLYAKNLDSFLTRIQFLRGKVQFPTTVLQAIMVAAVKREGVLDYFPEVNELVQSDFQAFVQDAAPFLRGRDAMTPEQRDQSRRDMAEALRERWFGTYMYYYYCGNLTPAETSTEQHQVN